MDDKDRIDALIKLAEFKRAVREGRRQYEFQMSATAYVALAALSVYPVKVPIWIVLIAALTACAIHTLWVYRNFLSNEEGRVQMYQHADEAEKILTGHERKPYHLRFYQAFPSLLQLAPSYALTLFAVLVRLFPATP
jgi:hypothetical protein